MGIVEQIENAARHTKSLLALEGVKRTEQENKANGHRYIKINSRTKVLVECDKYGKPTKRGRCQLESIKRCL